MLNQICSLSQKSIYTYPSEKDASVQILRNLQSLAKIVKNQTSYIRELEKKVDCLMVLVKKGEKLAEMTIKKMETMASRLTALATMHPRSSSITRNSLSDPQVLQCTYSKDKGIDKPEKIGLQKRLAGGPHLMIDLDKYKIAQINPRVWKYATRFKLLLRLKPLLQM